MKRIVYHYALGIILGLSYYPLIEGLLKMLPDIGWHFLTLMYIVILIFQVGYYYTMTEQRLWWSLFNFILNFSLWSIELVGFEKQFGETELFLEQNKTFLCAVAALFWITNKLMIDFVIRQIDQIDKIQSRMSLWLRNE